MCYCVVSNHHHAIRAETIFPEVPRAKHKLVGRSVSTRSGNSVCSASLLIGHLPFAIGSKRLQEVALEPLVLVKQKEVIAMAFDGLVDGVVLDVLRWCAGVMVVSATVARRTESLQRIPEPIHSPSSSGVCMVGTR